MEGALTISKGSLRRENGVFGAFVLEGTKLAWRHVDVGVSSGDRAEIRSGLREGEAVVLPTDRPLSSGLNRSGLSVAGAAATHRLHQSKATVAVGLRRAAGPLLPPFEDSQHCRPKGCNFDALCRTDYLLLRRCGGRGRGCGFSRRRARYRFRASRFRSCGSAEVAVAQRDLGLIVKRFHLLGGEVGGLFPFQIRLHLVELEGPRS